MLQTIFTAEKIDETSWAVTWTRSCSTYHEQFQEVHKTSSAITCIECGKPLSASEKWWTQSCSGCEKTFFPTKKFMKHQVQYHLLNSKKSDLFEKDKKRNIKHEQNVVKNGLNIIPARDVKMRWIVKVISIKMSQIQKCLKSQILHRT